MNNHSTEERGRRLAQSAKIRQVGALWIVPSESHSGSYVVNLDGSALSCTCPRFETTQTACKHVVAARLASTGTLPLDPPPPRAPRKKYAIDWPTYNTAQTTERDHVARLLHALCAGIHQAPQPGRGRRRLPLADAIFACVMKVFVGFSGRRSMSDVRTYKAQGLIDAASSYNSIARYLGNPALTPILKSLIEESALPMRAIERQFAADSTGFSTVNQVTWYDKKFGRERRARTWVKLHIMCGARTQIITHAEVTEGDASVDTQNRPLMDT